MAPRYMEGFGVKESLQDLIGYQWGLGYAGDNVWMTFSRVKFAMFKVLLDFWLLQINGQGSTSGTLLWAGGWWGLAMVRMKARTAEALVKVDRVFGEFWVVAKELTCWCPNRHSPWRKLHERTKNTCYKIRTDSKKEKKSFSLRSIFSFIHNSSAIPREDQKYTNTS